MTSPAFRVAVNRQVVNKSKDFEVLATGFQNYAMTQEQLAAEINLGHAFTTQHEGRRSQENFTAAQHIALDFDKASQGQLAEIMADEIVSNYFGIFYYTPSSTQENPKFRIIFQLQQPVEVAGAYRKLAEAFIWRFSATADASCKDPCRLFYGSEGSEPTYTGNVLPNHIVGEILSGYERELQYEESLRNQARKVSGSFSSDNLSTETKKRIFERILESHCIRIRMAEQGARHDTLLRSARALGGYLAGESEATDEYEVRRRLEEAYSSHQDVNRREMHKTLDAGLRYGERSPLTIESLVQPDPPPVGDTPEAAAPEPDVFEVLDFFQLIALPKPDYLVEPFLVKGYVSCIYGAFQTAKSFWALMQALTLADQGKKVLYLAGENAAGYGLRTQEWYTYHKKEPNRNFRLIRRPLNFLEPEIIAKLIRTIKHVFEGEAPVLIIVDTLSKAYRGGDENSVTDMGRFIESCEKLRDAFGATVLAVHHTGKNGDAPRGSSAILGDFDTIILAKRVPGVEKLVQFECVKQKDAPEFSPVTYRVVPMGENTIERSCVIVEERGPVPVVTGVGSSLHVSPEARQILEVMGMAIYEKGVSPSGIMDQLGIPHRTDKAAKARFNRTLDYLLTGKYIRHLSRSGRNVFYCLELKGQDVIDTDEIGAV